MCYKYNIVLELAKFENSFLALILSNPLPAANRAGGRPTTRYGYPVQTFPPGLPETPVMQAGGRFRAPAAAVRCTTAGNNHSLQAGLHACPALQFCLRPVPVYCQNQTKKRYGG